MMRYEAANPHLPWLEEELDVEELERKPRTGADFGIHHLLRPAILRPLRGFRSTGMRRIWCVSTEQLSDPVRTEGRLTMATSAST